jgi:hypothetical protein
LWLMGFSRSRVVIMMILLPCGPYDHYSHSSCCGLYLPPVYVLA